ncbi:glycosyltransferase [Lusitaniella coriacea LEGE 07157]|uniref:Glycosyltransferase n=1 Tax=Lusitaniella coriacea LEGE 07157 TaxID=945747 RepID=A0A8J7B8K1_9CYAN|nr:glycosyltransferase [Lusitaniella coriacea]MBE9114643.1 glycosyltransferase [Lusitaniella coriacea LEGE 07157]
MTIAYLINQYPKVSHSFIRTEIAGVEACGIPVARFAIRACRGELADEADRAELEKTRVVLDVGIFGLLVHLVWVLFSRPLPFFRGLWLAVAVGWGSERGLLNHFAYLAEACVLLHWFARSRVDRVHAHFGTNSTTVAMLCRELGGPPYSFTVHGPEEFDKVRAIALPEKIDRAAFIVAISSFGRSQLYRWCDREQWEKIHVVHCGVDSAFLDRSPLPIPNEPNLVCVGRLCEQKGQLLLLKAARQLAAENVEFHLTFVGDGELRQPIEEAIAQWGLRDRVKITGWASAKEVQRQILAARTMVLPSFAEGLPVVIMEALALNRPVLSTYVAGIPELVEPGVSGWLVPPGCVESLTATLKTALRAPSSELEKMGKTGATRVARSHNALTEAKKLAQLFQTLNSEL